MSNDQTPTDGAMTPRDVLEQYNGPDREPGALFVQLFTPKSRALILNVLVSDRDEALTVSEIVAQEDELAKSNVHDHIDTLLDLGVVERPGKKGNAWTYRLNDDHPVAQLLAMIETVFMWGRTPQFLDEAFVFEGDQDDLLDALEEEAIPVNGGEE